MCFTISKFIQCKQKLDKQRVWFLAFYASLAVKMGFNVVFWMKISAVNTGLRTIFTPWYFAWYFARKYQINIRYQSVISIKWLISRQPWTAAYKTDQLADKTKNHNKYWTTLQQYILHILTSVLDSSINLVISLKRPS